MNPGFSPRGNADSQNGLVQSFPNLAELRKIAKRHQTQPRARKGSVLQENETPVALAGP
jgi:hypothetical protein